MQAQQVDVEKKAIYEPCIPFFSNKYGIPTSKWTVRGILLGARGSLAKYSHTIFKDLGFYFYDIEKILIQILKDSPYKYCITICILVANLIIYVILYIH